MSDGKTDRLRIDGCESFAVSAAFITMEGRGYKKKKFVPTSGVSHLEVYQYLSPSDEKITLVYDTKARILTVDASPAAMSALRPFLPAPAQKRDASAEIKILPEPRKQQPAQKQDHAQSVRSVTKQEKPAQPIKKENAQPVKPASKQEKPTPERKSAKPSKKPSGKKASGKSEAAVGKSDAERSETLKNVGAKRLDWAVNDMKTLDGVRVKAVKSADGVKEWRFTDAQKHSVVVRQKGGGAVLTGSAGMLMTELRDRLAGKCDMRLLRKHLPVALRYLSEPSKIDLSNGLTDIANVTRLSDYSVLLMAPYRALEKLIYDLQQAENINVKMIGQAYEKDDEGRYRLKKGYLKRIDSVIYPEVMAALYTEYFAIRNFYTHSDNSAESQSRGISDRAEAQKILRNLLEIIEYNCKKLSEIGFTVAEE